ncbi:MAG: class I SAM-dependent methyltransferase [Longimicrobiales bacterium]
MLDLVRLSARRIFPPGGKDLYRQVARLTELGPGTELLDVATGRGIPVEYLAREYGIQGTGVEENPYLVEEAEAHARAEGLSGQVSFQVASSDDLPFRDETFDVVVGEVGLAGGADPKAAIRELVRVTRPGGQVVLIQLVWKAPLEEERRRILSQHLGARPLMMVEVRRVLLEAGVADLVTEDWSDEVVSPRRRVGKPFPDFSEVFSVGEKVGIIRRAWRRWGWRGVLTVFQREAEVHRLLSRERVLGLNLLKGIKATSPADPESLVRADQEPMPHPTESPGGGEKVVEGGPDHAERSLEGEVDLQTTGLPLFGAEPTE